MLCDHEPYMSDRGLPYCRKCHARLLDPPPPQPILPSVEAQGKPRNALPIIEVCQDDDGMLNAQYLDRKYPNDWGPGWFRFVPESSRDALKKRVAAYVKKFYGEAALTCQHDYEANTDLTEIRCEKCGVDMNLGEALARKDGE